MMLVETLVRSYGPFNCKSCNSPAAGEPELHYFLYHTLLSHIMADLAVSLRQLY
jgi:hypothetical protein